MGWIYCGCKVTPTEELHWLVCSVEPCQDAFIHTHMHNHAILSKWLPLTVVVSVCACVSKSLCGCLSVWIIFLSVLVNAKMVKALMFLCDTEMFAGYLFYSDLTCCPMSDSSKKKNHWLPPLWIPIYSNRYMYSTTEKKCTSLQVQTCVVSLLLIDELQHSLHSSTYCSVSICLLHAQTSFTFFFFVLQMQQINFSSPGLSGQTCCNCIMGSAQGIM